MIIKNSYANTHSYSAGSRVSAFYSNKGCVAPGCDGIPIEFLKAGGDEAIRVMTNLCNSIWKMKTWPHDWKKSIYVHIYKKGIPIEFLKAGGDEAIRVMTNLCNSIWKMKTWPHDWKKSIYVHIYKKGDTNNVGIIELLP